ncbi:MAG TPA: hypothetical protein EYP10_00230 [Armatimonadetes bacterium]|nr:hypothetical protein [Armatimonadota bacterium]
MEGVVERKPNSYPTAIDVQGLPSSVFTLWQITAVNPIYAFEHRRKLIYPTTATALFAILYSADVLLALAIIIASTSKRANFNEVMLGLSALFIMRTAICSTNVVIRTRRDITVGWMEQLRILPLPRRCLIWGKVLPYIEIPLMFSFGIMVLALPLALFVESNNGMLLLCHALLRWTAVSIFWIAVAPAGAFIGLYCALVGRSDFMAFLTTACVIIAIAFAIVLMSAFNTPSGVTGNWWLDIILGAACISAVAVAVAFYYLSKRNLS